MKLLTSSQRQGDERTAFRRSPALMVNPGTRLGTRESPRTQLGSLYRRPRRLNSYIATASDLRASPEFRARKSSKNLAAFMARCHARIKKHKTRTSK